MLSYDSIRAALNLRPLQPLIVVFGMDGRCLTKDKRGETVGGFKLANNAALAPSVSNFLSGLLQPGKDSWSQMHKHSLGWVNSVVELTRLPVSVAGTEHSVVVRGCGDAAWRNAFFGASSHSTKFPHPGKPFQPSLLTVVEAYLPYTLTVQQHDEIAKLLPAGASHQQHLAFQREHPTVYGRPVSAHFTWDDIVVGELHLSNRGLEALLTVCGQVAGHLKTLSCWEQCLDGCCGLPVLTINEAGQPEFDLNGRTFDGCLNAGSALFGCDRHRIFDEESVQAFMKLIEDWRFFVRVFRCKDFAEFEQLVPQYLPTAERYLRSATALFVRPVQEAHARLVVRPSLLIWLCLPGFRPLCAG
jgi:hypothetical protein